MGNGSGDLGAGYPSAPRTRSSEETSPKHCPGSPAVRSVRATRGGLATLGGHDGSVNQRVGSLARQAGNGASADVVVQGAPLLCVCDRLLSFHSSAPLLHRSVRPAVCEAVAGAGLRTLHNTNINQLSEQGKTRNRCSLFFGRRNSSDPTPRRRHIARHGGRCIAGPGHCILLLDEACSAAGRGVSNGPIARK